MSDAAEAAPAPPPESPATPVTSRSDPAAFLGDLAALAEFVDKLRASGVRTFEHPCGLKFSFEPSARLPGRSPEAW